MAVRVICLYAVVVLTQNSFLYVSANAIGLSNGDDSNVLVQGSTRLINEGLNMGLNNGICGKLLNNPFAFISDTFQGTTAVGQKIASTVTGGNVRCKKDVNSHKKGKEEINHEKKHENVEVIEGDGHVIVVDKGDHNNKNVVVVSKGPNSFGVVRTGGNNNFKYSSSTFSGVSPHGYTNSAIVGHSAGYSAGGSVVGVSGNGVSVATGTGGKHFIHGQPHAFQADASKVFNDAHNMLRLITSAANMFPPGCGCGVVV